MENKIYSKLLFSLKFFSVKSMSALDVWTKRLNKMPGTENKIKKKTKTVNLIA